MNLSYYLFSQYKMSRRAMTFGIVSIVLGFMYMPYFSIPIAFFAILFASLSRGTSVSFSKEAKIGITTAVIGILLGCTIFYKVYSALTYDADYRNSVIELSEMMYGNGYEEAYGESFSDVMDKWLPLKEGAK